MKTIDLRSDTVTLPTDEMMDSIARARLGDDVSREDPTVNELEDLAARTFGTEGALLFPSGTQSNLTALMAHCDPGEEVIMEAESHVYYYEVGGMSAIAGLIPRLVEGRRGVYTPDQVREVYRGDDLHFPRSSLLEIENTHNRAGGTVWTVDQVAAVADEARRRGMKVHMDGARVFNAAVALGAKVSDFARQVDSVSFCLSKSLSAPVGSLLVGSEEFIERCRKVRKMLGGGMRQAGIIAAPGLVAIRDMVDRLADDHRNARLLAEGIQGMGLGHVDLESVQTNIVVMHTDDLEMDAHQFSFRAAEQGVLVSVFGPRRVRFVTHRGIGREDIEEALSRLEALLQ
ncbi:MAG: threonine aldolase family protein [Methanomassiliicoccales archaeon]